LEKPMQRHKRERVDTSKRRIVHSGRNGNVRSRIEDTMQNKQEEGKAVNWKTN
jgi:hypothetical protein